MLQLIASLGLNDLGKFDRGVLFGWQVVEIDDLGFNLFVLQHFCFLFIWNGVFVLGQEVLILINWNSN
jgi:hypothetical protein